MSIHLTKVCGRRLRRFFCGPRRFGLLRLLALLFQLMRVRVDSVLKMNLSTINWPRLCELSTPIVADVSY